jgi:hypothetical protein
MKTVKIFAVMVALAFVFCAFSFAQANPVVNLYGAKGQVDLFAAELQKNGVTANKIYGEPAYGKYDGKKWPGVRYQIGTDQTEDGWIPVSNGRVKRGILCQLQASHAKAIADALNKKVRVSDPFIRMESGVSVTCSGDQCWPYDGSKGITISLREPLMFDGHEVRTFIVPIKEARPKNSIGVKAEWHNQSQYHYKTGWQPAVAFYNVTRDPNALMTPQKRALVLAHLAKIMPLTLNKSAGKEGDACYDLVINEDGSVLYDNTTLRLPAK